MKHAQANGIEIAYDISGNGPPIVLCHGGEADHRNFFNFAPVLARRLTVIAYDQRDTGMTRNPPAPYTLADLARDLGGLIEAIGYKRAHVFGTSYGGAIAQEAALQCAEKIDHLILSATWTGPGIAVMPDLLEQRRQAQESEAVAKQYRARFFSKKFADANPEKTESLMKAVMTKRTPEQAARRGANLPDTKERLRTVKLPTLVLAGEDDRILPPENSRAIAALIPGAKLELIPDLGHATTIEEPERVADAIFRFLGLNQ